MADATQQPKGRTQGQRDDNKGTKPTDLGDIDESSPDEISASMNIVSSKEERKKRHQGLGANNGPTVSKQDKDRVMDRKGINDEIAWRDELRPKDGPMGTSADNDVDENDEKSMPTGLPKKQGYEDYNPAARPHT